VSEGWSFDSELTRDYTRVRQTFLSAFLGGIRTQVDLHSAADVGCGVGYFSKFLVELGFAVVAVDGREENAAEGQRRHPEITFLTRDVEDPSLAQIGAFDLVLCVGLLYHLENPFRAIRNLHALTGKILFVESMCMADSSTAMQLLDESAIEDQGLNFVAFYPTEACLIKMLYRSGFPFVYLFDRLPDHPFCQATFTRKRQRTFMVASKVPVAGANLKLAPEPTHPVLGLSDPWTPLLMRWRYFLGELRRSAFKTRRKPAQRREGLP